MKFIYALKHVKIYKNYFIINIEFFGFRYNLDAQMV